MNSRERVWKAVNFEEPDRVPLDLGGSTGAAGIHVLAYDRLRAHLGLPSGRVRCSDVMQQLALVEPEIRDRFDLDVIRIAPETFCETWTPHPLFEGLTVDLPGEPDLARDPEHGWLLRNGAGKEFAMPEGSYYFDARDGRGWYSYAPELTDEYLDYLAERTRALYESTDCALAAGFGGCAFGQADNPDFLMDLAAEPEKVADDLGRACDAAIERWKRLDQAIGPYVFCAVAAMDYGTQRAPMIGPDMFREQIQPHYRRFTDWLHANTALKYFLHSCGAVEPLIESFIEMGVDILNPVQTSADGMDPAELKRKYGGRIVFWGGGCDTQNVLGFKSPEEVADHVRERVRLFAPGGGFVFNQVHAIQATVSPESVCALFDAAREAGAYPVAAC